jgi:hypothetical protein
MPNPVQAPGLLAATFDNAFSYCGGKMTEKSETASLEIFSDYI